MMSKKVKTATLEGRVVIAEQTCVRQISCNIAEELGHSLATVHK